MIACKECGNGIGADIYAEPYKTRMVEQGVCITCLHWLDMVAIAAQPLTVRAGGVHYVIGPEEPKGGMRGYGGARFYVHFNDGREVTTTNLWCQGNIPPYFRERLPDNATLSNDYGTI